MELQEHTIDRLLHGATKAVNAKQFEGSVFSGYTKPVDNGSATRSFVVIRCTKSDCDSYDVKDTNRLDLHPDEFNKVFAKKSWRISSGNKKAICPSCRSSKKQNDGAEDTPTQLPHALQPDVLLSKTFGNVAEIISTDYACEDTSMNAHSLMNLPAEAATMRASEKMARAETYLDNHFVKLGNGSGYYQPGCSDELGAAHAYLLLGEFKKIRKEGYGEAVDYTPVIVNATNALATAQRAMDLILAERAKLDAYVASIEQLPDDVQDFLNRVRDANEQLKQEGLERLERFEQDLNKSFADLEERVAQGWAHQQQRMEAAVAPKLEQLNEQSVSLERTQRTLNTLLSQLPPELVQAETAKSAH